MDVVFLLGGGLLLGVLFERIGQSPILGDLLTDQPQVLPPEGGIAKNTQALASAHALRKSNPEAARQHHFGWTRLGRAILVHVLRERQVTLDPTVARNWGATGVRQ